MTLSWVIGLGTIVTWLLVGMGAGMALYSPATRYEPSFAGILPMPVHLVLDAAAGVVLVVAAFVLWDRGQFVTPILLAHGVLEIGASGLIETESTPRIMQYKG